jgi:hypothetical protein
MKVRWVWVFTNGLSSTDKPRIIVLPTLAVKMKYRSHYNPETRAVMHLYFSTVENRAFHSKPPPITHAQTASLRKKQMAASPHVPTSPKEEAHRAVATGVVQSVVTSPGCLREPR